MEKRVWAQPMATVQKFIANEYVAACWNVKCTVVGEDAVKQAGTTHRAEFCGQDDHYQITDESGTFKMYEIKTDNLGTLNCTLYKDDSYTNTMSQEDIKGIKVPQTLYWTTTDGTRVWHHQGPTTTSSNHS